MDDKQYVKRVNQGYILAMHQPQLAEKLKAGIEKKELLSEQDKAFLAGIKEMEKEMLEIEKEPRDYNKPHHYMPPMDIEKGEVDKLKDKGLEPEKD